MRAVFRDSFEAQKNTVKAIKDGAVCLQTDVQQSQANASYDRTRMQERGKKFALKYNVNNK